MGYPFWLLKEYKEDGLWLRWKMLLRWFLAINKLWSTLQNSHGLKRVQFYKNANWLVKQIISGFHSRVGSDSILSYARRYTCLCKISRFLKFISFNACRIGVVTYIVVTRKMLEREENNKQTIINLQNCDLEELLNQHF